MMKAISIGLGFGTGALIGFLAACIMAVEACKIMED